MAITIVFIFLSIKRSQLKNNIASVTESDAGCSSSYDRSDILLEIHNYKLQDPVITVI